MNEVLKRNNVFGVKSPKFSLNKLGFTLFQFSISLTLQLVKSPASNKKTRKVQTVTIFDKTRWYTNPPSPLPMLDCVMWPNSLRIPFQFVSKIRQQSHALIFACYATLIKGLFEATSILHDEEHASV